MKKPAPAPQRKQSSEAYGSNNGGYNPNDYANQRGYATAPRGGVGFGGSGGYGQPSGSGGSRRPIKYESQYNYESDQGESGGAYSKKNRALLANNATRTIPKQQNEPILRTGRNVLNSELNALARNRSGNSQRDSPKNSRDPSTKYVENYSFI